MTFQADIYFRLLADLTTSPPIFILRDPRLSIASRMRMVADAGGDPLFPHRETGWSALYQQIQACRSQNLPYILINADDFRRNPVPVLSRLFALSSLSFSSRQLNWRPAPAMRMGNMDGAQDNFYVRVLNSQGLEPATESSPSLELFPAHTGLRAHVQWCMAVYRELLADPNLVSGADPGGLNPRGESDPKIEPKLGARQRTVTIAGWSGSGGFPQRLWVRRPGLVPGRRGLGRVGRG